MMVQDAPPGEATFVSTMAEHNDLCGQFARAFGNDSFETLDPFDEMVFAVGNHDRGWEEFDAKPILDPRTRLPAGLGGTPPPVAIEANRRSPEFNERHHPYCGLIVSMHSWGLFNARYGYSQFRVRPGGSVSAPIPPDHRELATAMLDGERSRQARLHAALAAREQTQRLVEESHLFQNYKQLQFFDTLALYFNVRREAERGEEVYTHVPRSATEDATVTLKPEGRGVYSLTPFPFNGDRLEVACRGRYVKPFAETDGVTSERLGEVLRSLPSVSQTYTFVAG